MDGPFRMPVQAEFKFTNDGDDRRIVAGTIDSGRLRVGDEVVFHPSGKRTRVKSLEGFNRVAPSVVGAGESAGFTLAQQIYVQRGELATLAHEPQPLTATRIRTSIFWLGTRPLEVGRSYALKLGTARVSVHLEHIERVLDASSLEAVTDRTSVERNVPRRSRPISDSTRDPAWCPCVSFTCLKWSRSKKMSETGCPKRVARTISCSSVRLRCRELNRPV